MVRDYHTNQRRANLRRLQRRDYAADTLILAMLVGASLFLFWFGYTGGCIVC